ncbi:MAG: phosphatase PAP2 family protein [Nitrospinota bacterium]
MPLISDEKPWYPLILAGFIYVFYKDRKKASIVFLMVLLALGISEYLTSNFFKPFLGRLRPCNALKGVHLLVGCSDSFSLPSAHAANAAAISTVVCYEYRKLIIYMTLVVILVCYSRVYLGVHYPFDVLMGMITGVVYGLTVVGIKKGLLKWNADNAD